MAAVVALLSPLLIENVVVIVAFPVKTAATSDLVVVVVETALAVESDVAVVDTALVVETDLFLALIFD